MFLRPRREAGDEGWARPDISAVGGIGTQNGTWGAFGGDSSRWLDGRLKTLAGGGTGQRQSRLLRARERPGELQRGRALLAQFFRGVAQANWQLAPKSPWSVGVRYVYADVDPTLRDAAVSEPRRWRSGEGLRADGHLEYDSRDNVFTPTRGIYAETSYMASRKALGATDDFERFEQLLIGWWPCEHA